MKTIRANNTAVDSDIDKFYDLKRSSKNSETEEHEKETRSASSTNMMLTIDERKINAIKNDGEFKRK